MKTSVITSISIGIFIWALFSIKSGVLLNIKTIVAIKSTIQFLSNIDLSIASAREEIITIEIIA